jgi:hypothetical protein
MDPKRRPLFNAAWSEERFAQLTRLLEGRVGRVPFRVAETPLLLTLDLRDRLVQSAREIIAQVSTPEALARLKKSIPARFDVPGMDALPNTVQVDFALVAGPGGSLEGKLIEMQGFPSLYALMPTMAECWAEVMRDMPGLDLPWSSWVGLSREQALALLHQTIVADCDPEEVVLVDIEPLKQKTRSDFVATKSLLGVDELNVTDIKVQGRKLFREKDGRLVPIRRIYNRMVFDELEVKQVQVPFKWSDDLDVSWCSHPNWYWTWSKACLPLLSHPAVPRTRLLSEVSPLPEDLTRYVLKPLFSFAGGGVVVDVTREAIDRISPDQRYLWVLMEKIDYAPAVRMPDGSPVKAEVRVMMVRPPAQAALTPLVCLVRLSRSKMIGVDFNKDMPWTGGSVGMWAA